MARYTPETSAEIETIIKDALLQKTPLKISGYGTKTGLGGQVQASDELSLAGHKGITDYQPEELVMVARAGTLLAEIEEALAQKGQMLAFEPPHLEGFYGTEHAGSLGGVIACNLSGPRRISAGAARDYLLGFDAVSGRAGYFRSGSKVMKNVTGYDLSKLMCGSFGMLAVMSEITLKVLPRPEYVASLSLKCARLAEAQSVLSAAFGSATEPSGGAILADGGGFVATIRLEGVQISVEDRLKSLSDLLASFGDLSVKDQEESNDFWANMRDISFLDKAAEQVWKLSVTPSLAPQIIAEIQSSFDIQFGLDWAGGLIWLSGSGAGLGRHIRQVLAANGGGHAMLMRASDRLRDIQPVFQPLGEAISGLQTRIKTAFDPENILNPQRINLGGEADANAF